MGPMKIIIAGPKGAGKTTIANFLSGQAEKLPQAQEKYTPTAGCRILEFELQISGVSGATNIELWDASGYNQYVCTSYTHYCILIIVDQIRIMLESNYARGSRSNPCL